ncbi:MAG: hypothetical protein P0S93_04090 [Candidatus Neptunochlamydia sp.]|nr:hypothetical protein [Candidatus Neptunochlamydia sp.]
MYAYNSGFPCETNPYLGPHETKFDDSQPRGPLVFVSCPIDDKNPRGILKNTSGTEIVLTGGDIIYHVAKDTKEGSGIHWIRSTIKKPLYDTRYAFCVTSDKYIEDLTDAQVSSFDNYNEVEYKIPANSEEKISLSHKPIFKGYHQNCSREIKIGDSGDEFFVLKPHYKNHALHPEFFKVKFEHPKPPRSLSSALWSSVNDITGIKMRIMHDQPWAEGCVRGNVLYVRIFPCFGAVAQNLFTLPTAVDLKTKNQDNDDIEKLKFKMQKQQELMEKQQSELEVLKKKK